MTDIAEVVLDARPGLLKGTISNAQDETEGASTHEVNISTALCSPLIREEILAELQHSSNDLYDLIKGITPPWLNGILPSIADTLIKDTTCTCGVTNCEEGLFMREYAGKQLLTDPIMRLCLMGLPRQELLSSVFGAWSSLTFQDAKETAAVEASLMEEKGKSGPSPGEWLAEAAEQGRMHEPGPLFRDVTLNLNPPEDSELHPDDWNSVLPGSPGVQKALRMIMKKTSDIAEKHRRQMEK